MGARRNFSRGGQNHRHFKKLISFPRAVQKIDQFSARRRRKRKFLRFLRRFRLKYRVSIATAEGASENFKVFCRTAAYDVIFSNSRGGKCPLAPLRAPMMTSFDRRQNTTSKLQQQIALLFTRCHKRCDIKVIFTRFHVQ